MSSVRFAITAAALCALPCYSLAATPDEIAAAIEKGSDYLKKSAGDEKKGRVHGNLGPRALSGLALLETGTPPADPVIKQIAEAIRDASYTETQTYHITLYILFLDRLGEPADRPLIQILGVRLVVGQNANGGWTYHCISQVLPTTEQQLRARLGEAALVAGGKQPKIDPPAAPNRPPPAAGKLHAEVEKYLHGLLESEKDRRNKTDDNSNTQFGILGVWTARKHGVPVEAALDLIEARFLTTQTNSGGWPYSGRGEGSPSMTCAGLLGLATAVGRREERTLKAERPVPPVKPQPVRPNPQPGIDPDDPFYNPPKPKAPPEPVKQAPPPPAPKAKRPPDARDLAIARGMENLAEALTSDAPGGKGKGKGGRGGVRDLYFLWSLERVGVIFGIDKIGKTDWYTFGADYLIPEQNANGSWNGRGGHGSEVETAFALLFLARSNLARDLTAKVQRDPFGAELRAGNGPSPIDPPPVAKVEPAPAPAPMPKEVDPPAVPVLPIKPPEPKLPVGTTAPEIAAELFRSTGENWTTALQRVRDAKGAENTSALLAIIPLLNGDRQKLAREALAERLCRMNANTLRGMVKADDAELRRAAVLACAMKDDKDHIPDLIAALDDAQELVVKAARAGLKSLTGKDFTTVEEWKEWHAAEKK